MGSGGMSEHALSVLDFPQALELVAGYASSEAGKGAVLALRPRTDREWLELELGRVAETGAFIESLSPWAPPTIPACAEALARLGVDGAVLEGLELHWLGVLLASSGELSLPLASHRETFPELGFLGDRLHTDLPTVARVEKTVDASGEVLDTASSELKKIRSRLRSAHSKIVRKLEAFVRDLPERYTVADASIGVREGRYVVPIRREGKKEVGGIVHDESHTGATLFVEPPVALALTNELKGLEREEAREVHRVLTEVTQLLRASRDALTGSLDALVELDSLYARARAAQQWRAIPPAFTEDGQRLVLVRGRHPLLLSTSDGEVVPFHLTLEPGEHVLVVSGPNTGGKSVLLKAVGLITALAQSGVIPPVDEGTRLPIFRSFFADIGDEQSIAESLSTFSAHLANWKEVAEHTDRGSLVLLDEMGTGTDPTEGAALSIALLRHLVQRGAIAIVTSHLGALKRLDTEGSGIVNASLQFDPDRMEPTYELVKGRPGRSYGLAIARRLGLPPSLLDQADENMSGGESSIEDLLERLERKDKEARELVASLEREQSVAESLRAELEARESDLRKEEREAERKARSEARQLLMEARVEVEDAIREVKEARATEDLQEVARKARRKVEDAARRQRELGPGELGSSGPFAVTSGDRVRVLDGGPKGVVVEVRDDRAVIDASGIRMKVPLSDLEPLGSSETQRDRRSASVSWSAPAGPVRTEVDLRGFRVDEVEQELFQAMDEAVLNDLPELRIIHGKGTGAVRSRVTEILESDGRVSDFRLGGRTEGGAGVTVVSFK